MDHSLCMMRPITRTSQALSYNALKSGMAPVYKSLTYYVATFLAGFSLMVVEITASRVVAPLIGASIFTWTAVIGVTLLGLSIGSFVGGVVADRYLATYGHKVLAHTLLSAAVLVGAIVPISQHLGLVLDQEVSIVSMAVIVSVMLFLLPALALGALSPIIFKLYASDIDHLGEKYGRMSGIWSLGSIAGVFITGFYFIPSIGTAYTLYAVAAVLLTLFYFFYSTNLSTTRQKNDIRFLMTLTLVLLLLMVFVYQQRAGDRSAIIFEKETPYYLARVLDYALYPEYGKNRILLLDIDPHSLQTERTSKRFYTDIYPAFSVFSNSINRIHVVGGGAYTLPIHLKKQYPQASVSVSEIDPTLEGIARTYFNLGAYDISTELGDARIKFAHPPTSSEGKYDLVYGDAYNSFISVPWHLLTKEYLADVRTHLNPGGVYAINFIGTLEGPDARLFASIHRTVADVFPNNYLFTFGVASTSIQNITIIGVAGDTVLSDATVRERLNTVDSTRFLSNHYTPFSALSNSSKEGTILTDDYAPVESMMAGLLERYFPDYLAQYRDVVG